MIKPTVGRIVWYWPYGKDPKTTAPLAAQIARVWSDDCINIGFLDENGCSRNATSVRLVQTIEDTTPDGSICCWMPYQQAKKE
jgi:hypothetical protein